MILLSGPVFALLFPERFRGERGKNPAFCACAAVLLGCFLGAAAMSAKTDTLLFRESWLLSRKKETVLIGGRIEEIAATDGGVRLLLGRCRAEESVALGRVYCYADGAQNLKLGMWISAAGTGKAAAGPRNPGEYPYRLACFSKGICGSFYADTVGIRDGRANPVLEALRRVREYGCNVFDRTASPKDAGIFKAALLGDRSGMDEKLYELYRENGIAHLLAISGLHISLIGMGLWKLLRRCGAGFFPAGLASVLFLLLYGCMVGGSASVVRAVAMMSLSFFAQWLGRTYDMISALCTAALLLLLPEPYLLTQAAFQLSFAAVGSIVFLAGPLAKRLGAGKRGQALLVSVSVQLATAPILLYHSFELPVYGVFLNLLVIPLMAYVVGSGLAALALFPLGEAAGVLALGGGHVILAFYEGLCLAVQKLPGAVLAAGQPKLWQAAVYYAFLAAGIFLICREKSARRTALGAAVCLAGFLLLLPFPEHGLSVTFLDVGQGDGIFLQAGKDALLVDCGSSQVKNLGDYRLEPFLKSRGVRTLSAAVVTHGDWDHLSGVRYLLEEDAGIKIRRLVLTKAGKDDEALKELEELAREKGTQVEYLERGDRLEFGRDRGTSSGLPVSMDCLSPPAGAAFPDKNGSSLVFLLRYGSFRLLLTGDVEAEGEAVMEQAGLLLPVTVLKAAHHGSGTSTTERFLEAVKPQAAVLSYGEDNRYGHPNGDVMRRLLERKIPIWETARSGAVTVRTDGKTVKIEGYVKKR